MQKEWLRRIPQLDRLLNHPVLAEAVESFGKQEVSRSAREQLEAYRRAILEDRLTEEKTEEDLAGLVLGQLEQGQRSQLRTVINGTGIVLHTNLGRAILSREAAGAAYEAALNYVDLEYDLASGQRGSRYSHVDYLMAKLWKCESALVVNNNAAAVLLMLSALAKQKKVVVSRGELVEIGGSFRVPEIMEQSGSYLVEVGTTNKTHLEDYERAMDEETGALLKVHHSNYKMVGFVEEVPLKALVRLGKNHGAPVLYDLGSGAFFPSETFGIGQEPNIAGVLETGVDVVCFSGDKLFGGPQAGILLGRRQYIEKMKKHPLMRAIRVDKLTLAALEATLKLYLNPEQAVEKIPTLSMLAQPLERLEEKGRRLFQLLCPAQGLKVELLREKSAAGGGSLPGEYLDTVCVALTSSKLTVNQLEEQLRSLTRPIIARIQKGKLLLDLRTIDERDFSYISEQICDLFRNVR